jgi:Putative transposase/Transposase zinc-binding domain
MDRQTPTVADVFRQYGEAYRVAVGSALSTAHRHVMTDIERCRTAALGGHVEQCDRCGHTRVWYNSCRNRHCSQCQSLARAAWIKDREAEILPTEYFHVVFTIPDEVAVIASHNKAVVYDILFRATAETLRTIAADPQHLGAQIGFFAVLHTWGQTLVFHPHLHCVVPGGGLSPDGTRWIASRPGFFLPVRVLSRLFRRLFLRYLQDAFDAGQLTFSGSLQGLADRQGFAAHLQPARETEWVVYAKPPFAGPQQVLDYVGRYTHRVAISNNRLVDIENGTVTFRYKDYRADAAVAQKTMTLAATEFIRRFLLHVLPLGFHRIRYYGFLATRHRRERLAQCRQLLSMTTSEPIACVSTSSSPADDCQKILVGLSFRVCPVCAQGLMREVEHLARPRPYPAIIDTS